MIQIDMQMPSCCLQCPMNHITNFGYMCILTSMRPQPNELREKRPGWCPLREGKKERKELSQEEKEQIIQRIKEGRFPDPQITQEE